MKNQRGTNEGKKKKQARKSGVPVHMAHRCSQSAARWLRPYNKFQKEREFKAWQRMDLQRAHLGSCGSKPSDEEE